MNKWTIPVGFQTNLQALLLDHNKPQMFKIITINHIDQRCPKFSLQRGKNDTWTRAETNIELYQTIEESIRYSLCVTNSVGCN